MQQTEIKRSTRNHRNGGESVSRDKHSSPDPKGEALLGTSWLSRFFFGDAFKILNVSKKTRFSFKDLKEPPERFTYQTSRPLIAKKLKNKTKLSLGDLISLFSSELLPLFILSFIQYLLSKATPFLIQLLLRWLQEEEGSQTGGLLIITTIVSAVLLINILGGQALVYFYYAIQTVRNNLGCCILNRIDQLSESHHLRSLDLGKVTVLLNSDIEKIAFSLPLLASVSAKVITTLPILVLLFFYIRFWVLLLPAMMVLALIFQEILSRKYKQIDARRRGFFDRRAGMLAEIVEKIMHVKVQTLEYLVSRQAVEIKKKEKTSLTWMGVISASIYSVLASSTLIFFFIFMNWSEVNFSTELIFCLIAVMQSVKSSMENASSLALILKSSQISIKRLEEVLFDGREEKGVKDLIEIRRPRRHLRKISGGLRRPRWVQHFDQILVEFNSLVKSKTFNLDTKEVEGLIHQKSRLGGPKRVCSLILNEDMAEKDVVAVDVDGCNFGWYEKIGHHSSDENEAGEGDSPKNSGDKRLSEPGELAKKIDETEEIFLKNIELKLKQGRFYGIIGGVGSGKSALLLSLQDKMKKISGRIEVKGRLSSIFQQPFLVNDTVRNNILFFNKFDEKRYNEVIKISSLEEDLENLAGGDMTEIGDNGANLSGGQRHRICIARALYENSDVYLIDDCLNALDNEIASSILSEAFEGYLGEKTRLMVTNNNKILNRFDEIIVMGGGQISFQGSYEELCKAHPECKIDSKEASEDKEDKVGQNKEKDQNSSPKSNHTLSTKDQSPKLGQNRNNRGQSDESKGKLTQSEKMHTELMSYKVFTFYVKKGGALVFFFLLALFMSVVGLQILLDRLIGEWANHREEQESGDAESSSGGRIISFASYDTSAAVLIALIMALNFIKISGLKRFMTLSTYNMFNTIVWKLLRRPLSYFHQTKSGVILNRCTDDIEVVDYEMQLEFHILIDSIMLVMGSWLLSIYTNPLFVVVVIITIILIYCVLTTYLRAAVDLKRLYRLTRSKVLGSALEYTRALEIFGESNLTKHLIEKWGEYHNESVNVGFHEARIRGWVEIMLGLAISSLFIVLCFASFFYKQYFVEGAMEEAQLLNWSLILTYTYLNREKVTVLVYNSGLFVNNMSVVERLKEFAEAEDLEAPLKLEENTATEQKEARKLSPNQVVPIEPRVGDSWPETGDLEFERVRLRYRKGLDYVIKGISFKIKTGEKVAIIGRSGSGKSTIFQATLRLLEIEDDSELEDKSRDPQPSSKKI